jgi:hypothetical protein
MPVRYPKQSSSRSLGRLKASGLPRNGVQAEGPLRRHPPAGTFEVAVGTPVPVPLFLFPLKVPGIRFPIAI